MSHSCTRPLSRASSRMKGVHLPWISVIDVSLLNVEEDLSSLMLAYFSEIHTKSSWLQFLTFAHITAILGCVIFAEIKILSDTFHLPMFHVHLQLLSMQFLLATPSPLDALLREETCILVRYVGVCRYFSISSSYSA